MEPQLPFVGMANEMQRLNVAFGAGDPLLLLGPHGSGKTRLIREALAGNPHVLYIAWEPTLHALLTAMARTLIAARHAGFMARAGVPSGPVAIRSHGSRFKPAFTSRVSCGLRWKPRP